VIVLAYDAVVLSVIYTMCLNCGKLLYSGAWKTFNLQWRVCIMSGNS
jgi:hypothetical protein